MNTNRTKLSLKLAPEVAKIMPFIISAKASGKSGHADWAKSEFDRASAIARERERWEHEIEERRREREWWQQLDREQEERERQAWLEKRLEEERLQRKRLDACNAHLYCNEDGEEEFLPSQSSQKGWRRLLSEFPQWPIFPGHCEWGIDFQSGHYSVKHNCGRKPRKPWFK
jgi:hypothetical protein